jgi:hypothetical protein
MWTLLPTKTYVFYSTLLHKARILGQAKRSGNPTWLALAQADHDEYAALCARPDVTMQKDIPPSR